MPSEAAPRIGGPGCGPGASGQPSWAPTSPGCNTDPPSSSPIVHSCILTAPRAGPGLAWAAPFSFEARNAAPFKEHRILLSTVDSRRNLATVGERNGFAFLPWDLPPNPLKLVTGAHGPHYSTQRGHFTHKSGHLGGGGGGRGGRGINGSGKIQFKKSDPVASILQTPRAHHCS